MIRNFANKIAQDIWETNASKSLPKEIWIRAKALLTIMHATTDMNDLKIKGQPPNIRLHKLQGNRKDEWSVTIKRKLSLRYVMIKNPKPLHPGVVLSEVYMTEMNLNQTQLAEKCGCTPRKINEIVNCKRAISPEFALILEDVLGTSAEMWVRIQAEYDLWVARKKAA